MAVDEKSDPILLVEVKTLRGATRTGVAQLFDHLASSDCPFGMFVDLEKILVFDGSHLDLDSPVLELRTPEALSTYEPDFEKKRISHDYLEGLVEAWLRDFAFHWKSEVPPFAGPMGAIGLAPRLAGGMTRKGRRS